MLPTTTVRSSASFETFSTWKSTAASQSFFQFCNKIAVLRFASVRISVTGQTKSKDANKDLSCILLFLTSTWTFQKTSCPSTTDTCSRCYPSTTLPYLYSQRNVIPVTVAFSNTRTVCLFNQQQSNVPSPPTLRIGSDIIPVVDFAKALGVHFDSSLSCVRQLQYVKKQLPESAESGKALWRSSACC